MGKHCYTSKRWWWNVSDSEDGGNSGDGENEGNTSTDRTWQPVIRPHVTNLKVASKLDKPTGKCKFMAQVGIILTVKHEIISWNYLSFLSQWNLLTSL